MTEILFRSIVARNELPALMTVVALLTSAMMTKLGHGWWGIALMIALCLVDVVRRPKPATGGPQAGRAPARALG